MITAIELTNFKTHESTALSFGRGTNVIVGVMGSGDLQNFIRFSFIFYFQLVYAFAVFFY